ncbi:hypothetical protein HELRODRAFT_192785, partial [Helobdella robusta]|uniref:Uncharacterized protein n=1 Tax=Helobdella robusta TaxID=6412 RepID=T1FUA5_HELRO
MEEDQESFILRSIETAAVATTSASASPTNTIAVATTTTTETAATSVETIAVSASSSVKPPTSFPIDVTTIAATAPTSTATTEFIKNMKRSSGNAEGDRKETSTYYKELSPDDQISTNPQRFTKFQSQQLLPRDQSELGETSQGRGHLDLSESSLLSGPLHLGRNALCKIQLDPGRRIYPRSHHDLSGRTQQRNQPDMGESSQRMSQYSERSFGASRDVSGTASTSGYGMRPGTSGHRMGTRSQNDVPGSSSSAILSDNECSRMLVDEDALAASEEINRYYNIPQLPNEPESETMFRRERTECCRCSCSCRRCVRLLNKKDIAIIVLSVILTIFIVILLTVVFR